MTSLKQQITTALDWYRIPAGSVLWVGSDDGAFAIAWERFSELMEDYPVNMPVAENLVLVGADWWIEKGCEPESWVMHRQPARRSDARPFSFIQGRQSNSGTRFLSDDESVN